DQLHRLAPVHGLAHHLDPSVQREQRADALADQGLVVDQAHADVAAGVRGMSGARPSASGVDAYWPAYTAAGTAFTGQSSRGIRRRRVKPCPGAVSASASPP